MSKNHLFNRLKFCSIFLVPLTLITLVSGCGSGAPSVLIPTYDPGFSGEKAMEVYDLDSDGFVAGEELEKAPGLKAALKTIDSNQDGKISEAEVVERIQKLQEMNVGLMLFSSTIVLDNRPLKGATITFEPDVFMGDSIQQAFGTSSITGGTKARIPKDKRPSPNSPPGVQPGIYLVRISKIVNGKEIIPAKYNTNTVLGKEVSSDDEMIHRRQVRFVLKSK